MSNIRNFLSSLGQLETFLQKKKILSNELGSAIWSLTDCLESLEGVEDEIMDNSEEKPNAISKLPLQKKLLDLNCDYYIFSDGGCRGNPGPGSFYAFIQNNQSEFIKDCFDFEDHTTNNRMELSGVLFALNKLIEINQISTKYSGKIMICTDSKYVIDGLKSWRHGWKKRGWKKADRSEVLNKDLWIELDKAIECFPQVEYHWVKGHSNFPQNEYCDQKCNEILDARN